MRSNKYEDGHLLHIKVYKLYRNLDNSGPSDSKDTPEVEVDYLVSRGPWIQASFVISRILLHFDYTTTNILYIYLPITYHPGPGKFQ